MKTNRPKIKVPLEALDIILDLISLTLLIFMVVHTFMVYGDLPETIATHFNASGDVAGFGDKLTLWMLPAIGLIIFSGMFMINKFLHMHNYMVHITEENALKSYKLSTRIVRFINFFVIILFAYIQYTLVLVAKEGAIVLGSWLFPTIILISLIIPAIIIIYQHKINKS